RKGMVPRRGPSFVIKISHLPKSGAAVGSKFTYVFRDEGPTLEIAHIAKGDHHRSTLQKLSNAMPDKTPPTAPTAMSLRELLNKYGESLWPEGSHRRNV